MDSSLTSSFSIPLRENEISVYVMGLQNTGKSSLVNCMYPLVWEPMDPGRKSISALHLVEASDAKNTSEDVYSLMEKKEKEYETLTPEAEKDLKEQLHEVYHLVPLSQNFGDSICSKGYKMRVVSIPGLGCSYSNEIVQKYARSNVHQMDVLIYTVSAESGVDTQAEMEVFSLVTEILNTNRNVVVLLTITKMDNPHDAALLKVTKRVRAMVERSWGEFKDRVRVQEVSAERALIYRYLLKHRQFGKLSEKHQSIAAQRLLSDSWEMKYQLGSDELLHAILQTLDQATSQASEGGGGGGGGSRPQCMASTRFVDWMNLFQSMVTDQISFLYRKKLLTQLRNRQWDPIADHVRIFESCVEILKHQPPSNKFDTNNKFFSEDNVYLKSVLASNLERFQTSPTSDGIEELIQFKKVVATYPLPEVLGHETFQHLFDSAYFDLLVKSHQYHQHKYLHRWISLLKENNAQGCSFVSIEKLPQLLSRHFATFRPEIKEDKFPEYVISVVTHLKEILMEWKSLNWIPTIHTFLLHFCTLFYHNVAETFGLLSCIASDILQFTKGRILCDYPGFHIFSHSSVQVQIPTDYDFRTPIVAKCFPILHELLHYLESLYCEEREEESTWNLTPGESPSPSSRWVSSCTCKQPFHVPMFTLSGK
jgi:hypothetical protein